MRVNLTLSEAIMERIKELAEEENRSLADMVRALVREALKKRSEKR
jgi:hypothetical protein